MILAHVGVEKSISSATGSGNRHWLRAVLQLGASYLLLRSISPSVMLYPSENQTCQVLPSGAQALPESET